MGRHAVCRLVGIETSLIVIFTAVNGHISESPTESVKSETPPPTAKDGTRKRNPFLYNNLL